MWLYGCVQSHSFYNKKDPNNNGDNNNGNGNSNSNSHGNGKSEGSGSIAVAFDDSKVHRAFNYSSEGDRIVLILDLLRPGMEKEEVLQRQQDDDGLGNDCHNEYEDDDGNDNRYDDRDDDDDISHYDGREDGDYYYPPGTAIGGHSDELDDFIKRFS